MCDKFSGADLKELCNQICKCAIKESIEADIQKKHLMKDWREADIDVMEDPVPVLTRRHFEYGLAHSRVSVGDADLSRYEEFRRKWDPNFNSSQNKNNQFKMNWPDSEGKVVQQSNDEDLDLYQ